jgi:branched-subunit amino acid ABC-type transport system permease component
VPAVNEYLPFLVVGIVAGSVYGLAGLGLVLTYRTSGVFNFAHGAVSAAAAYLYYQLYVLNSWPWPLAMLATVVVCGPALGVVLERLMRPLLGKHIALIMVATIGVLLLIQGALLVHYGPIQRAYPDVIRDHALPGGFTVSGVIVTWSQVVTVSVSASFAVGLYMLLKYSRLGVQMRAVVENPELLGMAGQSAVRVRSASWMLGSTFASFSGILLAPKLGLDAPLLSFLVVYSFGAVAIGRFSNLPLTFAGGLLVGVVEALVTKEATRPPWIGLPSTVPFLVLIVVLLITPARHLPRHVGRTTAMLRAARDSGAGAGGRRAVEPLLMLGALLLVPTFAGAKLSLYTTGLAFAAMFLSLGLLFRVSGQISLAHASFFALGATTFSHLIHDAGFPWLLALVGAGVVTVPLGALLALPTVRLSGVYLALVTFGFGVLMQSVVFGTRLMWGGHDLMNGSRPELGPLDLRNDRVLYYVFVAIVAIVAATVVLITRTRLGRLLRGLADSPLTLTTNGLGVNVLKTLVFCLSAFLAGIGGAMYVIAVSSVARDAGFGPFQSLTWLALLVVFAGAGLVASALLSGFVLVVLPAYLPGLSPEWQSAVFGAGALAAVLLSESGAISRLCLAVTDPGPRSVLRVRRLPAGSPR